MSTAGYSGTPLSKKLGIQEGSCVAAFGAPEHFLALLEPLPDNVRFVSRVGSATRGDCGLVMIAFFWKRSDFARRIQRLRELAHPDAAVWIAWPKKASKVPTDMTEDVVRELGLPTGLVDVKVCAIDDTWSGLKLVVRKELRGNSPQ